MSEHSESRPGESRQGKSKPVASKPGESQLASAVLMIRPTRFESNPMTEESNRFQGKSNASPDEQQLAARQEFESIKRELEANGVRVIAIDDTPDPHTPDSIFPNNWVSFHADGTVVLYPMEAPNRRVERRSDIIDALNAEYGFQINDVVDLSHHEENGHFLEGTGSMVLDRANRIAYACMSSRTHMDALGEFAQRMDYEVVAFDAVDRNGDRIYHTNVLMNVGETLAVICAQAIPDTDQRNAVLTSLELAGHEVVELTFDQLDAFAGNMLELRGAKGERILAMSAVALNSLSDNQVDAIEKHSRIVSAEIGNIEKSAGGSVRCMIAEIHLPLA
jgi:hypothetical protein